MKQMKKVFVSLFAMVALVCMMQISGFAAWNNVKVNFSSCTANSITVSWNKAAYLNAPANDKYTVTGYYIEDNNDNVIARINGGNTTSYTFKNLTKGVVDYVYVYATYKEVYTYSSGNTYTYTGSRYLGYTKVNTLPSDITKLQLEAYGGSLDIAASSKYASTGYQLEIYNLNTKKTSYRTFYSSMTFNINKDVPYRVRVRAYITNSSNNKTYYGAWSGVKYAVSPTVSGKSTNKKAGFTVKLKKATGVAQYDVYVSKNPNTGYAKTTTVKVKSKTKTTTIKKMGKKKLSKKTRYYVKVVPILKVNGATITSATSFMGSIYVYK